MENYIRFLFILFMCSNSYCDQCIMYNFEEGFDEMCSSESDICRNISSSLNVNKYSSIDLESPHPSSTTFLSPSSLLSLFKFAAREGTLELNFYTKSPSPRNYIYIAVENSLGGRIWATSFPNLMEGWHNFRRRFINNSGQEIYIVLEGGREQGQILLVDSFRYTPSTMNEEDCVIYDNTFLSTPTVGTSTEMDTSSGTDFDENPVTEPSTKSPTYFERCVKFNFENHYDTTFSSGSGYCTGANAWTLSNFTLLEMNCFHPLSTSFIAPKSTFSCITSPNFLMGDGTLEFNVYMGNVSRSNFPLFWMINILVQVKSDDGTDKTIATTSYNSHSDNFVPGWNTLKINVQNLWQEGHVVLMGIKTEGSIVFMDSFRFIPSTMNDDMCILYENQITTEDSEITKFTVTEAWETESDTEKWIP